MIVCTIALTLSEADRKKVIASLLPVVGSTRVQPGCQICSMLFDVDDPRVLVLWQEWLSQGDLDRHLRSADYRLVLAAMELSAKPPRITFDRVRQRSGLEAIEAVRLGGESTGKGSIQKQH
jgi:quinol monooxygenase YgiN